MKTVLANIKRIRKEQGIAQWRMAYLLHISKSTYTMNELGETHLTVDRLCKIAEILNKPVTEFFITND
jgi:transcriptional regulator with XRE-family HTH domain